MGACILACREVNICPEGGRKTALAWSRLRARPLPAGDPSQDAAWPWTSHTASQAVSGPGDGLCWVQCRGTAEVLGVWRLVLYTHCVPGAMGPEGAWQRVEASPCPTLSQVGVKSPGLSGVGGVSKVGIKFWDLRE